MPRARWRVDRSANPTDDAVVCKDGTKQLHCPASGTVYRALSADAATNYGLSPVLTIHDELGQVRGARSELFEALETASAAQVRPLSIIISTQAPTGADLLSAQWKACAGEPLDLRGRDVFGGLDLSETK